MNAIYARQSVDKADSLSIEGQIGLCRRLAGEDALVYQDRGFSGKNTRRPAFTELMRAVEDGRVRKVFVYRLDRFSRSIADFSRLWELLQQNGVEFVSVTEQFDTASPIGRAMLNIVLVFAQLERETTAERVRDNYVHRFRLGAWPGGPAPYGYDLAKTDADGRRVSSLRANAQSETVRRIFRAYAEREASLRSVARELTARGVHGPRREAWDSATLSRLLRSPLYVRADRDVYLYYLTKGLDVEQEAEAFDGVHACNVIGRRGGTDGTRQMLTVANHEGLVDAALWLTVQEKLSAQSQLSREKAGKHSWLTGLLKCAKCGYAVKLNAAGEGRLYPVCSGRSNRAACDASIRLDVRELEAATAEQLRALLKDDAPQEAVPTEQNAAAALALERKIARLLEALEESSAVSAAYISGEIERLHRERETLLAPTAPPRCERLDFDAANFAEKKLIAAEFIDRILLKDDCANIVWKV